ncbi:TRAP transporter large permease [Roseovarius indicus]|uniref:TRAP transporter large permease protein n=1 Tax=Roseovarius indicus TaxID=540747 RepID=A0A0T5PBB2_9RHOB|nr:TRAP transporter large permease [Roseovarius indicus]KRS18435.1 C4-dicarboxylate ABC transporter [Roseovarius indicus]QEW25406.1 Neu5Ac permease [Roseovarius indicus]SFE05661.1 TRAP transporter, DctM subunit [Roseovarius indicus]
MSDVGIGFTGLGILLLLLALRTPIGVALMSVSFTGLWVLMGWRVAWGSLGTLPYQFAANWVLSSVPMFLLLGFICYHTRLTEGLFAAARLWLGRLPGGLGVAAIAGSAGFAAVSGSSIACSATMGRIAVPEMVKGRYDPGFATGIVAVAGTIGALIPPSIIMILFGIVAQESIAALFLAGIAAGLITTLAYVILVIVRVRLNPSLAPPAEVTATRREKIAALRDTWPIVATMIGIFAGLFGGIFTPTEAGAVGAALATLVAVLKRSFTWARFRAAVSETLMATGMLLFVAIGASLLTRFLALSGASDALSSVLIGTDVPFAVMMLGLVLVYLLLGMFLEPIGAMLLTLPIVLPVIDAYGMSVILFGVILTKLLEIGMLTPPVGMNVFVIKSVVGNLVPIQTIFRNVAIFIAVDLVIVALLLAVPALALWLPGLL